MTRAEPFPGRSLPLTRKADMSNNSTENLLPAQYEQRSDARAIGEIIQITNNLSPEQVQSIVDYQRRNGVKFGEAAVALGLAKREDVLWALAQQFNYAYTGQASSHVSRELVTARDPFGPAAEVFRDLRSTLLMNVFSGTPRPALAVTSAESGEGKTFFSANLAVSLSQLGARTVLVDADLRAPRLHELFSAVEGGGGLSAILSGRVAPNVTRPFENLPHLYFLSAGTVPPNPLELVQGIGFERLLLELSGKFDYVIVDTPAAVHGADARVIAAKCGAALTIGRRHISEIEKMADFVRVLKKSCRVFAGVVMSEH